MPCSSDLGKKLNLPKNDLGNYRSSVTKFTSSATFVRICVPILMQYFLGGVFFFAMCVVAMDPKNLQFERHG